VTAFAPKSRLLGRLSNRDAVIGVFGLGYVGLPLVLRFSEAGYKVLGFDIDAGKIDRLGEGRSYIDHISGAKVAAALAGGFEPTVDFSRASERMR
jgi:UDP-N-acetyl-D-glucosamine dehydrogenase